MQILRQILMEPSAHHAYAVADAAVLGDLVDQLYALVPGQFACLLMGEIEAELAYVAPYLIALTPASPIVNWLEMQIKHPWGYLIESPLELQSLQRHLRSFTEVRAPSGETMYFRFWDPRVLQLATSILHPRQCKNLMTGIVRMRLVHAAAGSTVTNLHYEESSGKIIASLETLEAIKERTAC